MLLNKQHRVYRKVKRYVERILKEDKEIKRYTPTREPILVQCMLCICLFGELQQIYLTTYNLANQLCDTYTLWLVELIGKV